MGKKNGMGKYRFQDGRVYDGEWKDGRQNGKGKIIHADGTVVAGEWRDGKQIIWYLFNILIFLDNYFPWDF